MGTSEVGVLASIGICRFGKSANNFLFAKTLGIYLIPITIVVLYYSYTAILGHWALHLSDAIN